MASGPKWPRGQNFGLSLKDLVSSSKLWPWPRPQTFALGLASISLSYYVIQLFRAKIVQNSGILLIFPAIILNRMLLINIWYFFIIIFGLGLGLNLQKLASAS